MRHADSQTHRLARRERFAIPYSFKPRLSILEATIATAGAFLRIFLGSLLFAVWGVYTLIAGSGIHSLVWRIAAVAPMSVIFLICFAWLMWGISALLRRLLLPRP